MSGSNSGNANDRFGAGFGACDLAEGKKGPVLVVNKKKKFLNDLLRNADLGVVLYKNAHGAQARATAPKCVVNLPAVRVIINKE